MEEVVEDMWSPYKHLYNLFQMALSNDGTIICDLDLYLKKYKQNFTNFLRNPPKNEKSRAHLRTALAEGITLGSQSRKIQMSHELVDEAIILSDMFDMDEIIALELLCTAQRQQMHHPGLARGLIAVLLYYDGRKSISCALRDMFQIVSGVSWTTELPNEITCLFTNYVQNLVEESNLLGRLLELLDEMDVNKETMLLTKNRAFGSKKHQNQVLSMYEDIRKALAMALFNWSAQRGLPKAIAIRLLQQLANYKGIDAVGNIDDITLILLMALLYSFDTSVLQVAAQINPYTARLPILSDPEFAKHFHEALCTQTAWQTPHLDVVIKYSFAMALASLRHAPGSLQEAAGPVINFDEQLIDEALAGNVFAYFHHQLLEKEIVYKTEFIYRRMHMLITDFIDFMHAKVSELRGRADETARTVMSFENEGLEPPPNLDANFKLLMLCVAKLYGKQSGTINLCNEYWGPKEAANNGASIMADDASGGIKNMSRAISLFKFVTQASALLPQTLFKPYLKMITGLTRNEFAARCAFNLLKQSQASSATFSVCWDHFFNALSSYYNNMRNDISMHGGAYANPGESIYRSRSMPRNITQRETDHLVTVMGVMRAVAEYDEISRIMLCEHANWQMPQVLLGLVTCSTPLPLKAEIVYALASLGKSKETASAIWFHLEDSQCITTIPVSSNYAQCSLTEEIDQNESRLETYKLTRSVLDLLYTLMTTHMPSSLGNGPRKPGYDAYLRFVVNSVLLKFYNRAYKDPAEKWLVGMKCLKLLYFLLAAYKPRAADFLEQRDAHPHPGYHIMLQLQVKSDVLRLLLRIVETARERLDEYNKFRGKELLEGCALYALLLLELGLAKQNAFFEAHSAANSPILLSGLNRMLLDLNPRSRKPDYVLNIVKFVTYNAWLPRHTLAAIKILSAVATLPNVASQILNMYAQGSNEKLEIRQGFVECLELGVRRAQLEQPEQMTFDHVDNAATQHVRAPTGEEEPGQSQPTRISLEIKEAIVQLFNLNLSQPLPNFVYFLLGVDVLRDFMANEGQQLGIELNCSGINSLVLLLELQLERQRQNAVYCEHHAHIMERIYYLFYGLCANRRTSEPVLRYLRLTCKDFLLRHLSAMPFRHHQEDHVIHAMSHLMSCVTIEMRLVAKHGQLTRYKLLCDILLGGRDSSQHNGGAALPLECNSSSMLATPSAAAQAAAAAAAAASVTTLSQHAHSFYGNMAIQTTTPQKPTQGLYTNRLLDCLVLDAEPLVAPRLEFFDPQLSQQLLRDCESIAPQRTAASLINVRKLHDILHEELVMVQSTIANGQRKSITAEIEVLLQYAVRLNRQRTQRFATLSFMDAWCQLVQMLFCSMPESVMGSSTRKLHLMDVIEKILMKSQPMQPLVEISVQVSETTLVLLANLRQCCYQLEDQRALDEQGNLLCLTENGSLSGGGGGGGGGVPSDEDDDDESHNNDMELMPRIEGKTNISNLRFILKHLVEWIMISDVKSQKLRINLYSALLSCLRIVRRLRTDEQLDYNETFVARLDSSKSYRSQLLDKDRKGEMAAELIGAYGEKLIDTLCHDAVTGHDVCRMLALACMDMIIDMRAIGTLTEFIYNRGYLKQLLDGLAKSNEALCEALDTQPAHLRALFVYESRLSLLTRLAETNNGAVLLLAEHAVGVLSNMSVFDMQPDPKASEMRHKEPQSFLPSIEDRFRSILLPSIGLCDAIVCAMGSHNNSAVLQVLNFLFAHIDMVESMLRTATPFMPLVYLKQLTYITSLLGRTTKYDLATLEDSLNVENNEELRNRLNRLQQLIIVVFGRFTVSETTIRLMLQQEHVIEEQKTMHVKYFLEISANLSLYCRNAVTLNDGQTSKYLLTTMINDVTPLTGKSDSKKLLAIMQAILNQLKGSIAYYMSQKSIADNLLQQRASLPNVSFGPGGKQHYIELSERHNEKRSELLKAVLIAEQNLYLLWIHLDFYLCNAIVHTEENRTAINESNLDPVNMTVLNASHDEILQLKQKLISTFNETFCTQLLTASEHHTLRCKNFNAALLRRIKALVQFAPVN